LTYDPFAETRERDSLSIEEGNFFRCKCACRPSSNAKWRAELERIDVKHLVVRFLPFLA
jgi:hypothetical protein